MLKARSKSGIFGRGSRLVFVLLIASLFVLAACDEDVSTDPAATPQPDDSQSVSAVDQRIVDAHNRLGIAVFRQLLGEADGESPNVFISPTSIALALSMTYNGAEGATAEAMAEALQFIDLIQDGLSREDINEASHALLQALDNIPSDVRLDIANSIWHRQGLAFHEAFLRENQEFYRAQVNGLDFDLQESVDTINRWASDATEGLIPQIVEDLDPDLIMMLINAVYFKGDWTTPFDPDLTRDMPFHRASGASRDVPMMHRSGRIEYYLDDFQAIRLPYGDDEHLAMYVYVPGSHTDFNEFMDRFTYDKMQRTFERFAPAQGRVILPRIDISYKSKLNETLKTLGMGIAFDGSAADFSRMLPIDAGRRAYLDDVIHQSVLKVDEEGSEAAAITSVGVRLTSAPIYEFTFQADRPFLIVIRDDITGAVLFVGAIGDPDPA